MKTNGPRFKVGDLIVYRGAQLYCLILSTNGFSYTVKWVDPGGMKLKVDKVMVEAVDKVYEQT